MLIFSLTVLLVVTTTKKGVILHLHTCMWRKELVPELPKDDIIMQVAGQLNSAFSTVELLRTLMDKTVFQLPGYPIIMAMKGVGPSLGHQLMAEIGDVSHFSHKSSITAFADVASSVAAMSLS